MGSLVCRQALAVGEGDGQIPARMSGATAPGAVAGANDPDRRHEKAFGSQIRGGSSAHSPAGCQLVGWRINGLPDGWCRSGVLAPDVWRKCHVAEGSICALVEPPAA